MSFRTQASIRNCFDSNHSNEPDCRTNSHRKYCRIRGYDRNCWLQSLYFANQSDQATCLEIRQKIVRSTCSQERYERFLRSMMNYWNQQSSICVLSFIFLAKMDGLTNHSAQNLPLENSTGFQNLFSFAFLSVLGGQESECPMGLWAQSCQVVQWYACIRCWRRHSTGYPSKIQKRIRHI